MFKFKKIASVLASAIMLSSTIGFAAAASYPEPFVSGGTADIAVVYGAAAAISDLTAAIDLQEDLQALVTSTSDTSATASGGDSQNLATGSRKLNYADAMNVARTALTSTEMGDVLADGTFTDLTGTAYTYTQTLKMGDVSSVFGTSGGDLGDPKLYINVGTAPNTAVLYNYTLSLTKNLNVSDATNVQGQKIKVFGIDYVIGASSTNTTIYLYGAGNTITVAGGESQTVDIGGTEHTVELISTDSATQGKVSVDGVTKTVTKGSKYAFPGEVVVYVKDITHPAFAGDIRNAELIIGANTLLLQNGQTVKQGADETSIKGTSATITPAGGFGVISGITIQIAMEKSKVDHLAAGDIFVDPVFGGLEVTYAGAVPELDSDSRASIVIDTDNNQYAYVTFTSARAGTASEQKIAYIFDNNTASTAVAPVLAHDAVNSDGKGYIYTIEGTQAQENDWIIINQGDAGTILEVTDISHDTSTSGSVTVEDVITGTSQKITVTNQSTGVYQKTDVNFFGGTGYTVATNTGGTRANITWSAAGTMALYPRIKLKEGGWMAFLTQANVANGSTWILPNGKTALDTTGTAYGNLTTATNDDGIVWRTHNFTGTTGASDDSVHFYGINSTQTAGTTAVCNFNVTMGPAILILEPKKWDDSSYGDHICVPLTTTGTTEIAIADPLFNGTNSGELTFSSNTYKSQFVDKFGTVITKEDNTNENGIVTIAIPKDQMYLDVLFTAEGVTVTPGSGGSSGSGQVVIVKDSEASSVKAKNLIVVGGSCINTVAAKILGFDSPTCDAAFTTATEVNAGEYIIKVVKTSEAISDGSEDKVAMLVAGYNAADTVSGVTQAMDGVNADAGYSQVYPMTTTTTG